MDVFSNLMVIGECLLDKKRTSIFERAIRDIVKKKHIVLDSGTGSGVLAMLAAQAGAKKVYGIEIAPDIASFAKSNVKNNSLDNKVEIINSDIKNLEIPHPVDVLIMEMLDTGLVAEQQAVAINTLHNKGIVSSSTQFIPYRCISTIAVCDYNFNFYGLSMPFIIQARNFAVKDHINKLFSKDILYNDVDFRKPFSTIVNSRVKIKMFDSGHLNALVLKSKIFLSENHSTGGTTDMNMPVIIPLKARKVSQGEVITVHVQYKMSEGFRNFFASIV